MPRWGWWFLAFVMVARLVVAALFPIMPEEAYHWNFGRHLDWSYFDHPPLIAWSIELGCTLLGDCALGVRLVPVLFSLGTALLIARMAGRFYGPKAAAWSLLLLALEPGVFTVGSWGFPDAPLLFFWTLAMTCAWEALRSRRRGWWLAAGAAMGAAMLAKYTAAFLVLSLLAYLATSRRQRRWFATPWPYLTTAVALVVFSPVLYWNATHGWVSFRFQGADRFSAIVGVGVRLALRSLTEQWLMILPLTLPLGVAAGVWLCRSHRPKERFLFWTFAPTWLFFAAMGWTTSFHLLWPLPAYLGLTVAMAGLAVRPLGAVSRAYAGWSRWLVGWASLALLIASLYAARLLPGVPPVRGPYGWDEVAERVRQEWQQLPEGSFLIGFSHPSYRCASELAYHLGAPEQVYGNNLLGEEGLQYQFWSDPEQLAGRDALVVISGIMDEPTQILLERRFASVESAGEIVVTDGSNPRELVHCVLYRAHGYIPEARQGSLFSCCKTAARLPGIPVK